MCKGAVRVNKLADSANKNSEGTKLCKGDGRLENQRCNVI